jgi:hypothetical protein
MFEEIIVGWIDGKRDGWIWIFFFNFLEITQTKDIKMEANAPPSVVILFCFSRVKN